MNIAVFILCKNEEVNIRGCIESVIDSGLKQVTVLDSGSTDDTLNILSEYEVAVSNYSYLDHAKAYNDITGNSPSGQFSMILDADMRISRKLVQELRGLVAQEVEAPVFEFPVKMVWAGIALNYASLYPPKPIVYRGGAEYFYSKGHGEALKQGTRVITGKSCFIHDDRKVFAEYIRNQIRYAEKIVAMSKLNAVSWKDRIRMRSPVAAAAVVLKSYILQGGFLDGRAGLIYNIDRVIAELILYREGVRASIKTNEQPDE